MYERILIGWNLAVFFLYGWDKHRAVSGGWRVPENVLLGAAFLLGGIGGAMGMIVWHHKTSKMRFRLLVPCFLLLTLSVMRGLGI